MVSTNERKARGWSLTLRLSVALAAGAFFVAVLLGFLGADRADSEAVRRDAQQDVQLAAALAARAAPLLDRGDLMRLSVLAAVARDQTGGRVLVLDRGGRVVLDTALMLGDRQLSLLTEQGFQRTTERADGVEVRETLAPVAFGGERIGEVRLQRDVARYALGFDFSWFGLVLLCSLSLVATAAIMGHHWSARVRSATDALIRLSAGEVGGVAGDAVEGELQDLGSALREMERGVQDGLQRVGDGYVAMALQLVGGLERARLVPPGHGERTAQLAGRLADRLQLLPADRSDLELACRLVDLGKAWVRPSILQKHSALTEIEQQSLQHHPVHAQQQLECVPALRRVARILRHQLERYDGNGSPDALRGDRIPLASRVLSIAASFDLLTTCAADRPLDWQSALQQMAAARGEVFDPWLLELFEEEIRREPPPADDARPVMIVPTGSLPWRHAEAEAAAVEPDDDGDVAVDELEVMLDERNPEDAS
ncbi:MAG: HD domain-containing protein [Planctomycetes bacterium]|nr:HD domain-containing protein [Planctomycetota bacterium]